MISASANIYLPQIKQIWKTVFGDSDDYIRLFFKYKYKHDETLLYVENGKVRSMLFFPQYNIKIFNVLYKTGYICGAATRHEARGKGFMDKLLNRAFSLMLARGDTFSVLIPAKKELGDFYAKYGFRPLFKRGITEYRNKPCLVDNNNSISLVRFNDAVKIIRIYNEIIKHCSGVVLQNLRTYNTVIKINELYGASYIIRDKNMKNNGYLFCGCNKITNTLIVREIMAKNNVMAHVAHALFRIYDMQKIVFEGMAGDVLPFTGVKETGMIKALKNNCSTIDLGADYPYMNMMLD